MTYFRDATLAGFVLLGLVGQVASAGGGDSVLYVDINAVGLGNGSDWANAFTDLQDALATADQESEIEQVWVAEGHYTPALPNGDRQAAFQLINGVAIYGGFSGEESTLEERNPALHVTVLSGDLNGDDLPDDIGRGDNTYHVVTAEDSDSSAVLDGFTISGGYADGAVTPWNHGGGLHFAFADATISNCLITGNHAGSFGGGAYLTLSSPSISDCEFTGNTCAGNGGAMALIVGSSPQITSTAFSTNSADTFGGAIYVWQGDPLLSDCDFIANSASTGAGVYSTYASPTIVRSRFLGNISTGNGGGFYSQENSPVLSNCVFSGNSAGASGGAIQHSGSGGLVTLKNCTLANNSASAVGGGIRNNVELVVANSILWDNTDSGNDPESAQISQGGGSVSIDYSCVQGLNSLGGVGNLAVDPQFHRALGVDGIAGTEDDNLRLSNTSLVIDAADNDLLDPNGGDLDGNTRQIDTPLWDSGNGFPPIVDMGALESQIEASDCLGDANYDGVVDPLDTGYILGRIGCAVGTGDPFCDLADQNADGEVNPLDVGFVLARFGLACP